MRRRLGCSLLHQLVCNRGCVCVCLVASLGFKKSFVSMYELYNLTGGKTFVSVPNGLVLICVAVALSISYCRSKTFFLDLIWLRSMTNECVHSLFISAKKKWTRTCWQSPASSIPLCRYISLDLVQKKTPLYRAAPCKLRIINEKNNNNII